MCTTTFWTSPSSIAAVLRASYWNWPRSIKAATGTAHCVRSWIASVQAVLLDVDVQGALNIMEQFPDALSIFLETPSFDEYEHRLRARQTESEEVIQRRLQTARRELELAVRYRHRVVNDDLDRAVRSICDLLAANKAELDAG